MAKKKSSDQPKLRTREHIIADLAVNHFERQALQCGYAVDRTRQDYGIDLRVLTFNHKGELEAGYILVQLKATDNIHFLQKRTVVATRLLRSDYMVWRKELCPVILIVYDAKKDVAYWLDVQAYFASWKDADLFAAGASMTVHIPIEQALTPEAVRHFATIRDLRRTPAH